ncbi:trigger factor [bacterium 1XD42-54]|nr:trigger factor [bacterium 1XD42-54]
MRKRNYMAALACALSMTMVTASPATVMAGETEAVTEAGTEEAATEAGTEEAATEAGTEETATGNEDNEEAATEEAGAEKETEHVTEKEAEDVEPLEVPEKRPDYKASEYVTLGEYKGVTVQLSHITEDDVEKQIQAAIRQGDLMETLTEGKVQTGDIANIDYEGKLNGEPFDGGTAKGFDLNIGSGEFIPGFEDGLIGVAVGETVDLKLTFPEGYNNAELAGKETVFTVTVNEIKRMPELNDELVSTLSEGAYTDVASYRASVKEDLENGLSEMRESEIKYNLLVRVAETSEVKGYPQELVDYGVALMESAYREMAEAYSVDFAEFLSMAYNNMTVEQFRKQAAVEVQMTMQQELLLKAVAEAEGIEISDEDYAAGCEEYRKTTGFETVEELIAYYGEDQIRISVLQNKVLDFLMEHAIIEEETEPESAADEAGTKKDGTAAGQDETKAGAEETETE